MTSEVRPSRFAILALVAITVAACGSSAASPSPTASAPGPSSVSASPAASAQETVAGAQATDYSDVDVCQLATATEVTTVMGEAATNPQPSVIGPGAAIDGAAGCTWTLGGSIDLFDLWIYPSASMDLKTALADYWTGGYQVEPISGIGDEAYAAVWRGDASVRTVGQVAGVAVRLGGKSVLLSTLKIGADYTDPKPAAQLGLTILGRF
jgi:hypothetical protein